MPEIHSVNSRFERYTTPNLLERDFPSAVSVDSFDSMDNKKERIQDVGSNAQQGVERYKDSQKKSAGEYNSDEDTIYFKPRKIYRLEQESGSRQTLVRVYSDTEKSNFNQVTGKRMFDDWKYRPIYHYGDVRQRDNDGFGLAKHCSDIRRRFSTTEPENGNMTWDPATGNIRSPNGDMQDEYIPGFDFAAAVKIWEVDDDKGSNPGTSYNVWSEEESDYNLDSASSSGFVESSHAQVSPIPFPMNSDAQPVPNNSLSILNKTLGQRAGSRFISPSNAGSKFSRSRSTYDWGSLLSVYSAGSFSENLTRDEIKAITEKIPEDFLLLPYTQRKRLVLEIAPDKDYKTIMHLFKKYHMGSGTSLTRLNTQTMKRSRQGSLASQYLSSLTPSSSSFKPDDRGSIVLGHRMGKIIGFGAWGMIRECYEVKGSSTSILSPTETQPSTPKAIKVVKFKNNGRVKRQVLREISIWKKLRHPNILELLNWKFEDDYAAYCLTGKVQDGTLYDLVSSWGHCSSSSILLAERCRQTIALSLQLISALKYMHSNYIVHADIKLENCLLERLSADSYRLYVCDFGMSCYFGNKRVNNEHDDPNESIEFASAIDGKLIKTKRRPEVPKSVSNSNVKSITRMQKLLMNKKLTHDDTPLGISSFPKQFGPSLTSTIMSPSHGIFKRDSPRCQTSNEKSEPCDVSTNDFSKSIEPHSHIGSLPYAAPELIDPSPPPLGPSADIWAIGVTMFTMLTGKLPFKHEYEPRLRAMISSGKYDVKLLGFVCNLKHAQSRKKNKNDGEVKFYGLYNGVRGCLTKDMTQRWELDMVKVALHENNPN
ncbi:HDL380Wp [Eremothecium sinecaudum]|uniref:non-specific serine/threonine protein kinase n=1 Tax=Eremothecium sinecaudum TaxID=45286 RepID=A0A0X8HS02_9SACH|nr:HDL380Wp [Eremothecium sinecaudum]AMD20364.1 HDL380Wp [Eremothecium sinecaudum]